MVGLFVEGGRAGEEVAHKRQDKEERLQAVVRDNREMEGSQERER